ncbi:MAG TPA: hypothetical protein ENH98_03645 [archaeon]|nr:hypothetical protein [archaeon]
MKFKDVNREDFSLQESSLATDDCVWLGIDKPSVSINKWEADLIGIKYDENGGGPNSFVNYKLPETAFISSRMHLNREQVSELLPHLKRFVDTGGIVKEFN